MSKDEHKLSLYKQTIKMARHYFCFICGIYTHHQHRRTPNEYGYNVACIDGLNLQEPGEILMANELNMSIENAE